MVRFARSGDAYLAYEVVGSGPVDLLFVNGFVTHLDSLWEIDSYRRYCECLGEFTRLIVFDKRGMGMSDRISGVTTLEERMDDVRTILDNVGSERAFVMGESEGGPLAMLFAAAFPERCSGLILQGAEVREERDESWPWGEMNRAEFEHLMGLLPTGWGAGYWFDAVFPSLAGNDRLQQQWGKVLTNAATPSTAELWLRTAYALDVRHVTELISVPALILHSVGDKICHIENARFLHDRIDRARLVELPGSDHLPWFDPGLVLDEIREFVTGRRESSTPSRRLATVLFTDIVGSTELAAEVGDQRWRILLEQHNSVVRQELRRFDGHEVSTTGDGFLATFDGPARAVRCAESIMAGLRSTGVQARAGLHAGEIEILANDVAGLGVHIGARVADCAAPGEILVSSTVKDLVAGSGLSFEPWGSTSLKGVPGEWQLWRPTVTDSHGHIATH